MEPHTVKPGDFILIVHPGLLKWRGRICRVTSLNPRCATIQTVAVDTGEKVNWTFPSSYAQVPKNATPDQIAAVVSLTCPKKK